MTTYCLLTDDFKVVKPINWVTQLQQLGYWDTPNDFMNNYVIKGKVKIDTSFIKSVPSGHIAFYELHFDLRANSVIMVF